MQNTSGIGEVWRYCEAEVKESSRNIAQVVTSHASKELAARILIYAFKVIVFPTVVVPFGIIKFTYEWFWKNQTPYDFSKWFLVFKR